ncbi:MAG: PadR family transcriptional regulator [Clostridia bacterium]|nr:PadR family transcriptional regulator [Clostridia bacterium]
MKISKELLKGTTGLVVLSVIAEQDMYGYQITQTVKTRSDSALVLNEGTLYPILHSFEKNGYLTSYKDGAEGGRERKYYKITAAGKLFLQTHLEEWSYFTSVVNKVLAGEN